jgi:putative oxidoreductase
MAMGHALPSEVAGAVQRSPLAHLEHAVRRLTAHLAGMALVLAPAVLRVALALPFFRSGLTRWDGFLSLAPATSYLFEEEFRLHLFGATWPIPAPQLAACLTALAEIGLPILLVLGLATRFAALGLLLMTGVIQLVMPDAWASFHLQWAAMALAILALGAGRWSLDAAIGARWHHRRQGSASL